MAVEETKDIFLAKGFEIKPGIIVFIYTYALFSCRLTNYYFQRRQLLISEKQSMLLTRRRMMSLMGL